MYHICVCNQAVRCCAVNGLNSGAGAGINLNLGNADLGHAGLAGIHIVVDHDSAGSVALGKSSAITAQVIASPSLRCRHGCTERGKG